MTREMNPELSTTVVTRPRLGKYRLKGWLGRGGQTIVFRAESSDGGTDVALKVIDAPHPLDPESLRRFRNEAELLGKQTHANVVRLLDFSEEPRALLVFELLDGLSLRDLVDRGGPLSERSTLQIAVQIARALAAVHASGVVHRDIKPTNVLLTGNGVVKLIDFGIAVPSRLDGPRLTPIGLVMGTPAYMAPERFTTSEVSPASDVYSAGLVMAELMLGRRLLDSSWPERITSVALGAEVALPREVTCSRLGPIIERATRNVVTERYPSGAELLRELEELLSPRAVISEPIARASIDTEPELPTLPMTIPPAPRERLASIPFPLVKAFCGPPNDVPLAGLPAEAARQCDSSIPPVAQSVPPQTVGHSSRSRPAALLAMSIGAMGLGIGIGWFAWGMRTSADTRLRRAATTEPCIPAPTSSSTTLASAAPASGERTRSTAAGSPAVAATQRATQQRKPRQ